MKLPYKKMMGALLYLTLATACVYLTYQHWAYDDPFITYRYAQNITRGAGMVYNPGSRVLSTTTPFFALTLGALGFLWGDIPALANLIGAFSLALGGLFLWVLADSWRPADSAQPLLAGWAGLLLYPLFTALLTTMGSETPLYLALCLGAFVFYARGKYTLAAIFAALATLTRPDGILIPGILALDYLLRERHTQPQKPFPWKAILLFAGALLPWAVFSWWYFGSPLPVTLVAKQQQAELAISTTFSAGLWRFIKSYGEYPHYILEGVLALVGWGVALRTDRRWLALLVWPVLYAAAYSILNVSTYFWYYAPLVPGFVAAMGLGLSAIPRLKASARRTQLARGLLAGGGIILLGLAILHTSEFLRLRQIPDQRYAIYRATGEWLHANTLSQATVGALEIGIIGYFAERPMIDFAGLIQPETAAQFQQFENYQQAAHWANQRFQPEYLALLEGTFPQLEQEYASQQCALVQRFSGSAYGFKRDMLIYHCP